MKKFIFAFAAIIFITGIAFINLGNGKDKTIKADGVLTVNDIQSDPYAYKGTITITGVVAGFSKKDPKVFAVIDTSEAKTCKTTGCARFYLLVRYEGLIPKEWDEVNITGSITKHRGPLFEAAKVDILRHLTF